MLHDKIKKVQTLLSAVEANKLTYVQNLKTVSAGYYEYSVIEMDGKGKEKETIYSFGLSDINSKSVKSYTKKDVILIKIAVKGKQKLIKKSTDEGNKISYLSDFTMYGLNAENGRDLEKAIIDGITDAINLEEKALSLETYQQHINWLKSNIINVTLPKKEIEQQIDVNASKPGYILLRQVVGTKEKRLEFNLSMLNPNAISYKISGSEFCIELTTKKGIKGVKYFEEDNLKGFEDKIVLYASSIKNGKNCSRVLKSIIPLAETEFNNSKPNISSIPKALKYINDNIQHIATNEETLAQSITLDNSMTTVLIKETKANKSNEDEYYFNLMDINKPGILLSSKKNKLFLELSIKKGQNFIGHVENGEVQNYTKVFSLFFNSIDEAIISREALQFLIEQYENKIIEGKNLVVSLNDALTKLKKEIVIVRREENEYDQYMDLIEAETSTLKFTSVFSNSKKSKETILEFTINDLNKQNVNVKVSGKRVWVELTTKGMKKVIKVYEDGQVQNYQNKISVEATSIENAKNITQIFKNIQ